MERPSFHCIRIRRDFSHIGVHNVEQWTAPEGTDENNFGAYCAWHALYWCAMTELQGIMPKVGRYCAPKLRGLAMKWQVRGSTNHSGNPANTSTVRFSGIGAVALFGICSAFGTDLASHTSTPSSRQLRRRVPPAGRFRGASPILFLPRKGSAA